MLLALGLAALAYLVTFVYCSFFEWTLHKYIMHSDRFLKYAHQAHQLEHHEIFKADGTYYLGDEHTQSDERHLTFAWWNAPLLFSIHAPLGVGVWFLGGWGAIAGMSAAMGSYYALYEYFHYCMHVPGDRWFERTRFFKFVQTHHRLHHVYYLKNLNVVIPIADFFLRTRVSLKDPTLFETIESTRQRRMALAQDREEALVGAAPQPTAS